MTPVVVMGKELALVIWVRLRNPEKKDGVKNRTEQKNYQIPSGLKLLNSTKITCSRRSQDGWGCWEWNWEHTQGPETQMVSIQHERRLE